jgi:hypothetical protein
MCYSSGANAICALPCVGQYGGWIWWIVSAVFMVKDGQKVSGGRAAFSVLAFPLALMLGGVMLIAIASILDSRSTGAASTYYVSSTQRPETGAMTTALRAYAAAHNNRFPAHALEMVPTNHVTVSDFIATGSDTTESDVPVADIDLDQLQYLPANRKRMSVQAQASTLPANVIAHRVGDFVFTYHGIDVSTADPQLWIVIFSEDPEVTATTRGFGITAGRADGTIGSFTGPTANELAAQNALRSMYGLAPLPDPATVTHAQPAVGK